MTGKITLELIGDTAADLTQKLGNSSATPHRAANTLIDVLSGAASGNRPSCLRVRVDDSTGVQAGASLSLTYASLAAGDFLWLQVGSKQTIFTCVSTTPVAGDNTFQKVTDATATATSLKNAINSSPDMRGVVTATSSLGVVVMTSTAAGTVGNSILVGKSSTSGITLGSSTFLGGIDPGALVTVPVTVSTNPVNGHTMSIGGKTLFFVLAAVNQNQVTIGGDEATTAANLLAVINANTDLAGLVVAAATSTPETINLTLQVSGSIGLLVALSQSDSDLTFDSDSFVATTGESNALPTQTIPLGRKAAAA